MNTQTQENRILELLQERGSKGVFVYELIAPKPKGLGIAQYNARIKGLRKRGYNVKNVTPGHFVLLDNPLEIHFLRKIEKKTKEKHKPKQTIIYWNNGKLEQIQV